jgi:pimeloyl-ACP methyl ester carboxylesterase
VTTYILIAGACHAGWWYEPVVSELEIGVHQALPVTLEGLDPDFDGSWEGINLDSHVAQVCAVVEREVGSSGSPVVLVGHSYGGSVITAVADGLPAAVNGLVYLDAFVPENGQSCYSMTDDEQRRWYIEGSSRTGLAVDPLPFFDPRARPHPLGCLIQASKLTGAWTSVPIKHYVAADAWAGRSPFADVTERLEADGDWRVHHWPVSHNVLRDGPDRLVRLLTHL